MDVYVNEDLAKHLLEVSEYYKIEGDTYRSKTFLEASQKIELYPDAILSGQDAKDKIGKGIGSSTIELIDEFLNTGTSKRLEDLRIKHEDREKIIRLFTSIYGIGIVRANEFYDLGFRTLDDLWYHAKLTTSQQTSIYYREHLKLRIPRDEMEYIDKSFHNIFSNFQLEIVGSYRRGEPDSGDIDVLIKQTSDVKMDDIVNILDNYKLIVSSFVKGEQKYTGLIHIGERPVRQLDILLINPNSWGSAMLYFTGSQRFNILIRRKAKEMGLRLNEYGLYDIKGNKIDTYTEEQIFSILGLKYLSPRERTRYLTYLL